MADWAVTVCVTNYYSHLKYHEIFSAFFEQSILHYELCIRKKNMSQIFLEEKSYRYEFECVLLIVHYLKRRHHSGDT